MLFLIVSTSAIDCLERLISEMTCYMSSGTLNPCPILVTDVFLQFVVDVLISFWGQKSKVKVTAGNDPKTG